MTLWPSRGPVRYTIVRSVGRRHAIARRVTPGPGPRYVILRGRRRVEYARHFIAALWTARDLAGDDPP